MSPDAALIASDPANSAWVSANAGSGKTYVLTARVIRLLLAGTPPDRLLCLTYTRAAAAEMRARVFEALGRWALISEAALSDELVRLDGVKPDVIRMARARRLFALALETPGGLKIQTIHAFCEKLLGRFPVEASVPVPFRVLTETEALHLKRQARAEVLQSLDAEQAEDLMIRLAPYLNEQGFTELFEGTNARRIAMYGDADPWAATGLEPGLLPEDVERDAGFDAPERVALYRAAREALSQGSKKDVDRAAAIDTALLADDATRFERMTGIFLTQDRKKFLENYVTNPTRKENPALFEKMDDERQRVEALLELRAAADSASMVSAVAGLARLITLAYDDAKRAAGGMDFDDLIQAALHLLRDSDAAQWALYKLDGGIDHILIDEAQDTSPEQWRIVERLAEEFFSGAGHPRRTALQRTLFAVGDEKQSIFSFQGADPAAFARFRDLFQKRAAGVEASFRTPTLNTSRRSAPAVLALVDAVFDDNDLRRAVAGGAWADHVAHRKDAPGYVELWPLTEVEKPKESADWAKPVDAPPVEDAITKLAEDLACAIRSWIGREQIGDDGALRPLTAGDVLILVRSRGRLSRAIIRKLKQHGVPVAGADRLALLDHIAVKDLIAYGRAALLPQDDLNLAALLRSPFFAVSEDHLFRLAHGRAGSLWQALTSAAQSGQDIVAAQAHDALSAAINRLGRDSPFDFYARLLAGGGRKALLARLGEEAEDVIDEFLAAASAFEDVDAPSLERFLHTLEDENGEVKRDPDAVGGTVRVLTAHGAKGLEAPVVIMPDTMSLPRAQNTPDILELNGALVWGPSGSPEAIRASENWQAAEHDEHKRLLYVALTRPRDRLIVCGARPGKSGAKNALTWYQAVLVGFERLKETSQIDTPSGPGKRYGTCPPPIAGGAVTHAPPVVLPHWASTAAAREEPVSVVRPSRLTADITLDDAARTHGLARGRAIHRLLQSLPDLAPDQRASAAQRFLEKKAPFMDTDERAALTGQLLTILQDARFAAAFAPGSRAEAAIAGRIAALGPDGFISGQIDRLAVTDETVLIVDFKTNRQPPATENEVPAAYLRQMALYREAMRAAFPGRMVQAALLWTETPAIMALSDSILDTALVNLDALARRS